MKEEDSTNRTGILRNAPTGIKLQSPAFGDCKLSCVIEDEMTIEYFDGKNPDYITLDKYGRFKEDGECILYPNKYKHDWNGWQAWLFRDELSIGQIVVDALGGCFIIINNSDDIKVADASGKEHILESKELDKFRFATPEEKLQYIKCESKYITKELPTTEEVNSLMKYEDSKQEIEDNLRFLDEYVMEMQDMMRIKPIVTNLERIREYIDIINTKISNLK